MNTSTRALVLSMLALVLAACGSVPRKGASPASAGNGHAAAAPVAAWPSAMATTTASSSLSSASAAGESMRLHATPRASSSSTKAFATSGQM